MDDVNKPEHYQDIVGGMEAIDVIEHVLGNYHGKLSEQQMYALGNVLKYILRAPFKGSTTKDLRKSEWYLRRLNNGSGSTA